jgi:hypothetical protein
MRLRAAAMARLCLLALVLAALHSFAYVTWVPRWLQIAVAVVPGLLTLWRPLEGLQLIAAFIPLVGVIGLRFGAPVLPFAEAMALSAIAGALARSLWKPLEAPCVTRAPLWLFGLTIAASLVVALAVLQMQTDAPGPFIESFARWLTHGYFTERKVTVTAAALLLEGLGLFWVAAAVCAAHRDATVRLVRMVVLGASAAALLNMVRVAIGAMRSPAPLHAAWELFGRVRVNIHFGDVNAAGSQFALALCLAAGLAAVRGRTRPIWIACAAALAAGLWQAGSRTSFVALAIVVVAAAARMFVVAPVAIRRRMGVLAMGAALLALLMVVAAPRMADFDTRRALWFRISITETSLRMTRANPIFGAGIGRFYAEYPQYSSPALRAIYQHENAHNNFLQVLAELGAIGLVTLLTLLYAAAIPPWRAGRTASSPLRLGMAAGLVAFAITMLCGHPLLIPEVAFTFWLVLGAWSAGAVSVEPKARPSMWRWLAPAAAVVILLSLCLRVPAARSAVDLEHVEYGFSRPERGPEGDVYRRVDGRATFFAPTDVRLTNAVEVPIVAEGPQASVEFSFDGRPGDPQRITSDWRTVRLPVLPATRPFRRVDILTDGPVRIGKLTFSRAALYRPPIRPAPRRGDFDGDGRTDIVIFRPQTGDWHIKLSAVGFTGDVVARWGQAGDIPVAGDYDGDGRTDTAVFRPATGYWFVQTRGQPEPARISQMWGLAGDIPVPGDYDGDRVTDFAVYRPLEGAWYVRLSGTGVTEQRTWGLPGDVPVPGDYDGDGRDDVAVYRPSEGRWHVALRTGDRVVDWGLESDYAMSGDFDGDGVADFVVWRPSDGGWYIRNGRTGETRVVKFGQRGDIPVPGNYGTTDRTNIAVFRPRTGRWYMPDAAAIDFGEGGDIPPLAARRRQSPAQSHRLPPVGKSHGPPVDLATGVLRRSVPIAV